jgi:hypothetical protein
MPDSNAKPAARKSAKAVKQKTTATEEIKGGFRCQVMIIRVPLGGFEVTKSD